MKDTASLYDDNNNNKFYFSVVKTLNVIFNKTITTDKNFKNAFTVFEITADSSPHSRR